MTLSRPAEAGQDGVLRVFEEKLSSHSYGPCGLACCLRSFWTRCGSDQVGSARVLVSRATGSCDQLRHVDDMPGRSAVPRTSRLLQLSHA